MRRLVVLSLLVGGLALLAACGEGGVGAPAPDFNLPTLSGQEVRLSDYAGQPVIVHFWATWCGPCRVDMPQLQALHKRHGGDIVLLAISEGERAADVAEFVGERSYTFTVLLDFALSVGSAYRVRAIPTTVVIDSGGTIRYRRRGVLIPGELDLVLVSIQGGSSSVSGS